MQHIKQQYLQLGNDKLNQTRIEELATLRQELREKDVRVNFLEKEKENLKNEVIDQDRLIQELHHKISIKDSN